MGGVILYLYKALLDFVYPPLCYLCNNRVEEEEGLICKACWRKLNVLKEKDCADLWISKGAGEKVYFTRLVALWEYDSQVQRVIHLLKYQGRRSLAQQIGQRLATLVSTDSEYREADLIVPVPLHHRKFRERGYNQSWLLGKAISEETGIRCEKRALKRIRYTRSQTELKAKERLGNVKGAFKVVKDKLIKDKVIIVIDDLVTTGSTINSCAQALVSSGARKVLALAAARPVQFTS